MMEKILLVLALLLIMAWCDLLPRSSRRSLAARG